METRASHMIVGLIVITFAVALLGFMVWIAKVDLDADYDDYDIYFSESVSGLENRGTVFYQGIAVGEIRAIDLLASDTSKVHVHIRVRADVPVTEATVAELEFQGLTGVSYIQLTGGSPDSPRLLARPGNDRPIIPSKASAFAEIFSNTPAVLEKAIEVLQQINKLLADETIRQLSETVSNINRLSGNLADGTSELPALVTEMRVMITRISTAGAAIEQIAITGTKMLSADAKVLMNEATATMASANQLIQRLADLVAANEPAVTQFTNKSLPEITRMIIDLRKTARSLSRLVTRIEQNPAEALFGGNEQQYDLETRSREKKK